LRIAGGWRDEPRGSGLSRRALRVTQEEREEDRKAGKCGKITSGWVGRCNRSRDVSEAQGSQLLSTLPKCEFEATAASEDHEGWDNEELWGAGGAVEGQCHGGQASLALWG
jgi:hypothetical protein